MLNPLNQFLRWAVLLCLIAVVCTGLATAQLPIPPSTQFDISGFLQEATVTTSGAALSGGTLKVNGHLVTVPANTIVILPANALTWEELFAQSPSPYTGVATGMALADVPAPLASFEVHVVGNRVGNEYIAGLIDISQNGLNSGAGFINFIDYTLGEMRVGGIINDPNCAPGGTPTTNPNCSGTRVRINDPNGRYGLATTSPDVRFTVDPDNPTIMSATGYPMCLPRATPAGPHDDLSDSLCPQDNRPLDLLGNHVASFETQNLTNTFGGQCGTGTFPQCPAPAGSFPDSTRQAPFEIGDFVTFAGTLVQDCAVSLTCPAGGTIVGPWPVGGTAATWISAHTIVNNIAIYTYQGSNPAYIETDVTLIGTGGLTVLGAGEAAIRTRFEGMMTDPSRSVHLYAIDLDPATGATTDRDWGTIGVDQGPPLGAVKGRWRFRPPCLSFGTVPTKPDKQCVYGPDNSFLPPTREMRSVIEGLQGQNPASPTAVKSANGIYYGQYHAPILEYIFPENIPGTPIVENNFNSIPFLACGGYTSSAGTLVKLALDPWPSNIPVSGCASSVQPPTVTASATPNPVAANATVTLSAAATGTAPLTFAWTQTGGTAVTLVDPTLASTTFTAPSAATASTLTFQVAVSNSAGSVTALVSVNVDAAGAPTVSYDFPPLISVVSGTPLTITATGVDPNGLPLTVSWRQTGGSPLIVNPNPLVCPQAPSPATCKLSFTVTLPIGSASTTALIQAEAVNSLGIPATPDVTTVTIVPQADHPVITSAVYRTGKQRLDINVTSDVISPTDNVFLDPYLTQNGTMYDPATGVGNVFVNNGGGLYTISMVGAPPPACNPPNPGGSYATPCTQTPLVVRSSFGGVSPAAALTKIRQ